MFQEGLVNQAGSGGVVACRQGLNFTRGMFLECRHLSQTHSAQTSAVSSWNAGSDSPVQPLKCKINHKKNKIKSLRNDVPNFFSKRQVLVFPHQDCIKFFFTKQTAKVSYFKIKAHDSLYGIQQGICTREQSEPQLFCCFTITTKICGANSVKSNFSPTFQVTPLISQFVPDFADLTLTFLFFSKKCTPCNFSVN